MHREFSDIAAVGLYWSSSSESETRPKNVVYSVTRPTPSKSGLETDLKTKTDLVYYNTSWKKGRFILVLHSFFSQRCVRAG